MKINIACFLFLILVSTVYSGDVTVENGKLNVNGNLYVDSAGNVGIGTTSPNPSYKLDVIGQIHSTGDICTDAVGGKCLSTGGGAAFDPESYLEFYEDFESTIYTTSAFQSKYFWDINTCDTAITPVSPGTHGIIRIQNNVGGVENCAAISNGFSSYSTKPWNITKNPTFATRWAPEPVGGAYKTASNQIGFADNVPGSEQNGLFFNNSYWGNIFAVAKKNNVVTILDTGVALKNGSFHKGKFVVTGGGTSANVYIDGVLKGTISTNLPNTAALGIVAGSKRLYWAGDGMDLDYIYAKEDR